MRAERGNGIGTQTFRPDDLEVFQLRAAPIMLSLEHESSASWPLAFAEFNVRGLLLRGVVDLFAFVCEVWAL
jgi:hypothetical protein